MSSMSRFTIDVIGPVEDRSRLAARIEAAAACRCNDGDTAIPFASLVADWPDTEEYRAFWITSSSEEVLMKPDGACFRFDGESRNTPPVRLLLRLSEEFSVLSFRVRSTTDHLMCEEWLIRDGRAKLIQAVEDGVRGEAVWYVKDGIRIRPLPTWILQAYPMLP